MNQNLVYCLELKEEYVYMVRKMNNFLECKLFHCLIQKKVYYIGNILDKNNGAIVGSVLDEEKGAQVGSKLGVNLV